MAVTVEFDGTDRSSLVAPGWGWDDQVNGRPRCTLRVIDNVGGFVPANGDKVEVKESGTTRFEGVVYNVRRTIIGLDSASAITHYGCEVGGYEYLVEKRLVWGKYAAKTITNIITTLNTNYFDSEGLSLSIDAISGADSITVAFNGETGAQALDLLCELADDGRQWWIDDTLTLHCEKLATNATPATLNADNILLDPPPTVEDDKSTYANRVTVIGHAGEEGDFPIIARQQDSSEITTRAAAEQGSGVYEYRLERREIRKLSHAKHAADAYVTHHGKIRKHLTCSTRTAGFAAGQQGTVNLPNLGLSSTTMYVESVRAEVEDGGATIRYHLSLVTENPSGSWRQYWRTRNKYPPGSRFWEEPENDKPKRRQRKRKPKLIFMEGRHRREGTRVGIPRGGRNMMDQYTSDGVTKLIDGGGYVTANLETAASGGGAVAKAFLKNAQGDDDDLGSVPDDAGGTWRKVTAVDSSNQIVGNSCALTAQVVSGTASDASFVNVGTGGGSLEQFYDIDTDDRFEAFSHTTSASSFQNNSGGNSGYSFTRGYLDTS